MIGVKSVCIFFREENTFFLTPNGKSESNNQIPFSNRSFQDYKKPVANDSDVAWQQCS